MVRLTIRMDDITPNMDWRKFFRFKELLDYYGIKPLLGVVPENRDESLEFDNAGVNVPSDFWQYIRDLQYDGWTVAMHGLNHVYTTLKGGIFPLNHFSEFAGLCYDEQYELLSYGVDIFNEHNIPSDIFMAPGHSFDKKTLKALKELGFSAVTDGFGNMPFIYRGMEFYPISFIRSHTLKDAIGYSTLVYHANTMNDKDFEKLEKLLSKTTMSNSKFEFISYKSFMETPKRRLGHAGWLKIRLMAGLKHFLNNLRGKVRR